MATQSSDDLANSTEVTEPTVEHGVNRQIQTRIKIHIPKAFHQEPVISRLVSHHGVTVNIAAALLGPNDRDDGWFDLELIGTNHQIQSALTYLDELDLEIWNQATSEEDGW